MSGPLLLHTWNLRLFCFFKDPLSVAANTLGSAKTTFFMESQSAISFPVNGSILDFIRSPTAEGVSVIYSFILILKMCVFCGVSYVEITLHCQLHCQSVQVTIEELERSVLSPLSRVRSVTISLFWSWQKLFSFLDEDMKKQESHVDPSSQVLESPVKQSNTLTLQLQNREILYLSVYRA